MAPEPVTTAAFAAAAAKRAIENAVDSIYDLVKERLQISLQAWRVKKTVSDLYKSIAGIRKVKTIWQVDREVDLFSFYYPSKIALDGITTVINDRNDFQYQGNLVIEGTVGQGKSIFLRYLTIQQMYTGYAIPLFLELRRILRNKTLKYHLMAEMENLGIKVSDPTFALLLSEGRIVLFLDGFDEVPEAQRTRLTTEIESLIRRHENLRIIITSRACYALC